MFLLIPIFLILISSISIEIIIYRKKPYLHKLALLESGESSGLNSFQDSRFVWWGYAKEFFPELDRILNKIEFEKHRLRWLVELEKTLRRVRLVSLRFDRFSDVLISKVRRSHINSKLNSKTDADIAEEVSKNEAVSIDIKAGNGNQDKTFEFLKNEEQRLIMEIAKNPKDSNLYELLGDLYMEMGSGTDAKESYEAAIELNSQNESLKQKLSSVLEKLNTQN